ncbi:MAG: type IV conjugative transfer system protein TraL [Proteobacteria bacterium]|nr:type IV conjugative transfer system protein TraL [Pseudomonadota bacterium]
MSHELELYYIPKRLDDPERIMFWSSDELAVIFTPFIVIYFALDMFITAAVVSTVLCFWWKKFKGGEQANLHLYAMYWFYPASVMGLKATPRSYIRTYYG